MIDQPSQEEIDAEWYSPGDPKRFEYVPGDIMPLGKVKSTSGHLPILPDGSFNPESVHPDDVEEADSTDAPKPDQRSVHVHIHQHDHRRRRR